jgi:hypothetical protein
MRVSGQHHAPAALLPPGKGPPVPIVQEAGWAPEPVWTQRLEEKSSALAGDRTLSHWISKVRGRQPVVCGPHLTLATFSWGSSRDLGIDQCEKVQRFCRCETLNMHALSSRMVKQSPERNSLMKLTFCRYGKKMALRYIVPLLNPIEFNIKVCKLLWC